MKKFLMLTAIMGLGSTVAFAQDIKKDSTEVKPVVSDTTKTRTPQKKSTVLFSLPASYEESSFVLTEDTVPASRERKFETVDASALPAPVRDYLKTNYPEDGIKEAYVSNEEIKVYKFVILVKKDNSEVTVLVNEKGEKVE